MQDGKELFKASMFAGFEMEYDYIELKNILVEDAYVDTKFDTESWQRYSNELNVSQLQRILRENNLKISGNKSTLIQRITENLDVNKITSDYRYFLTSTAYQLLSTWYYPVYFEYLQNYEFHEFEYHCMVNRKMSNDDIVLSFLDEHETNAIEKKNIFYYIKNLDVKSELLDDEYLLLRNELKHFIALLNPVFLDEVYYRDYFLIDLENIRLIGDLIHNEEVDFQDIFNEVYNEVEQSFGKMIVSVRECWKILVDGIKKPYNQKEIKFLQDKYLLEIKQYNPTTLDDFF